MSTEPESQESATAEPKSPSLTMTKARAAVHSDRVADAERGRARTASLPSLDELELTAEQIDEETVTVSQAADLLEVSQQAVNQLIVRGSLVAYRNTRGRRVITLDDLVEASAARKQAQRLAEELHTERWSQSYHETNGPPTEDDPHPDWCAVCARANAPTDEPAEEPAALDGLDDAESPVPMRSNAGLPEGGATQLTDHT